jgi:metal-responsive CopG/Arc/MetJ family transcriptional regulator
MAKTVGFQVDDAFLEEFDRVTRQFGYDRAEAIREAMREFLHKLKLEQLQLEAATKRLTLEGAQRLPLDTRTWPT